LPTGFSMLRRMSPRSNTEWERWGEVDPLWAVASWAGKEAGSESAWTEEEFYALGSQDWTDFLAHWKRYGVTPGSCVEIGCGAGRLTVAMTEFFAHVHAVDVAQGMLDRVPPLPNVTLHKTDGLTLPLDDGSVDAAFSTHAFQHFDSTEDAQRNWREIGRVLRPGGTLMVHLPVHIAPLGLGRTMNRLQALKRRVGGVRAQLRRKLGMPVMRGRSYEWDALSLLLEDDLGLVDVELAIFRTSSNGANHPFVLARQPLIAAGP
jgi:SAM-dependent methyltransferase